MDRELIEQLAAVKRSQHDDARPAAAAQVHATGRLTARQRIAAFLDPGSAVEYGSIAARTDDGAWVAEAGGVDFVGTVGGQTVIASSTDYTDRGGGYGAGRLERLFGLAQQHGWPVVLFADGGGSRARHPRSGLDHLELNGSIGRFTLFDGMAELSGWVPTVAIVSGPAFAGHASLAGFSDIVIATGGSSIGMGGPPMVEAALGQRLTPTELAGVDMHETTGGIDLLVADEHDAIAAARRYLSYRIAGDGGAASAGAADIADLVPEEGPYDIHTVIEALVDDGSMFELRPAFGRSLVTALARIDGCTVGVLASQPGVDGGAIDVDAADKISRFVELCDSYEYPMLSLVDTPGCISRWPGADDADPMVTEPSLCRRHARPIMAHQRRTVPLFAVQLRQGGGLGPALMMGVSSTRGLPVFVAAWPTTELGRHDGFSAVRNANAFDDVIAPAETRPRIGRLLRHLPRAAARSAKKHPIDSW